MRTFPLPLLQTPTSGAWPPAAALSAMKVFVIYDHDGAPEHLHHKLAITLPSKWLEQSCEKVKEAFVNAYNKKFPDNQLDDEELVLSVKDNSPFTSRDYKLLTINDTPSQSFEDKGEVRLVPAPPSNAGKPGALPNGKLRCKNYGCQCEYDEAENSDTACRHHVAQPIFHDTRKWWSCCEGVKVYSIDEVCGARLPCGCPPLSPDSPERRSGAGRAQGVRARCGGPCPCPDARAAAARRAQMLTIPGCAVGRHSSVPPAVEQQRNADVKAATSKARMRDTPRARQRLTARLPWAADCSPPWPAQSPHAPVARGRASAAATATATAAAKSLGPVGARLLRCLRCTWRRASPTRPARRRRRSRNLRQARRPSRDRSPSCQRATRAASTTAAKRTT